MWFTGLDRRNRLTIIYTPVVAGIKKETGLSGGAETLGFESVPSVRALLSVVVAAAIAAVVVAADAAAAVPVGVAGEAAAGAAPAAVDAVASHPRSLRTLRCSTA